MATKSVMRQRGEGQAYWVMGVLMEIKVASDETAGQMTVVEMTAPPGPIPMSPKHTHPGAETVYVLDGMVRWHVEDEVCDLSAGAQLHIPASTWEWAENITKQPVRLLVTYSGKASDMDKFFREVGEVATSRSFPGPQSATDLAKMEAVGKKYGMQMQVPPRAIAPSQPSAR